MSQIDNDQRGIRWLAIFEQSAGALLVALVVGVFATFVQVNKTADSVAALVVRMDRMETKTDTRIQVIERDVTQLKIDVAKIRQER